MSRLLAFCVLYCTSWTVWAQDTLESKVFTLIAVEATRVEGMGAPIFSHLLDSVLLDHHAANTLAEVLQRTAPGQLRGYGPSGANTPSFRGTGAAHTAVLWNGINISNPMLGQFDLSLIPIAAVDEVKIEKSGSSSQYGSGAIGGTIHLNQHLAIVPKSKLSFSVLGGGFGRRSTQLGFELGNSRFASSSKLYLGQITNDFPFYNTYLRPESWQTRQNNAHTMYGLVQQLGYQVNANQRLDLSLWYHHAHYEIPNSILADQHTVAHQTDDALRGVFSWNYQQKNIGLTYKQAFTKYDLRYQDDEVAILDQSGFFSWVNRLEGEWKLPNHFTLVAGLSHTWESILEGPYGTERPQRHGLASYAAAKWADSSGKIHASLAIRQEILDGNTAPVSPNFGVAWQIMQSLEIKGNISRNYRIPTFNDLHWASAGASGNPDLKPESSIGGEMGAVWQPHHRIKLTNSVFHQSVDNWILWQPEGAVGWTPMNVKKVWARGLESRLEGHWDLGKYQIRAWATYQYTRTTNEAFRDDRHQLALSKQLAYSPMHEATLQAELTYQRLTWLTSYAHVGKQYTENENKEVFALPAYGVLNSSIRCPLRLGKTSANCWAQLNNILDTQYENRRGFPMYRRNFQLGIHVKLNHKRS